MVEIRGKLGDYELRQVATGDNGEADLLQNMVAMATGEQHLTQPVPFKVLHASATKVEETLTIEVANT